MGVGKREFKGMIDCMYKIYLDNNIKGLYQGLGSGCICYFIYRGLQIGGYDSCKHFLGINLNDQHNTTNKAILFGQSFLLSLLITEFSATIAYTFDTIRRKLMMNTGINYIHHYNGYKCAKSIIVNDGYLGFYKGLGVNYLRAFTSAFVLAGFDQIKPYLTHLSNQ